MVVHSAGLLEGVASDLLLVYISDTDLMISLVAGCWLPVVSCQLAVVSEQSRSLARWRGFCFSTLSSEYQVQTKNLPTLLLRFGVEVLCFQGSLLWFGGWALDSFWGEPLE